MSRRSIRRPGQAGQGLTEFAVAAGVFMMLLIGVIDLGRGVYVFNGVSEAAREIARTTSIFPGGSTLGSSSQTAAAVSAHKGLVPGLETPTFSCTSIAGDPESGTCDSGEWVKVTVSAPYQPATPLLAIFGSFTFTSSSSAEIQ